MVGDGCKKNLGFPVALLTASATLLTRIASLSGALRSRSKVRGTGPHLSASFNPFQVFPQDKAKNRIQMIVRQ